MKEDALLALGYTTADALNIKAEATVFDWLVAIQKRADERGVSQVQIARSLGCTRSQLNRWFRCENGLNAKNLFALAYSVGFDPSAASLERVAALKVFEHEIEADIPAVCSYWAHLDPQAARRVDPAQVVSSDDAGEVRYELELA